MCGFIPTILGYFLISSSYPVAKAHTLLFFFFVSISTKIASPPFQFWKEEEEKGVWQLHLSSAPSLPCLRHPHWQTGSLGNPSRVWCRVSSITKPWRPPGTLPPPPHLHLQDCTREPMHVKWSEGWGWVVQTVKETVRQWTTD